MTQCRGRDTKHLLAFLTVRKQDSMLMKERLKVKKKVKSEKVVLNTQILE